MKPETQFIYKEPFNGSILNTMHNGIVDYTGERVERKYIDKSGANVIEINFNNGLTFEQYNQQKGGNCKVANNEEIDFLFSNYENSLIEEFKEISEERYFELLECLPPVKWHKHKGVEIFFVSEAFYGKIHTCVTGLNGRYFSAHRKINEPSETITNATAQAFKTIKN